MKNILGILASPRKMGNCEIMVKEVSRHVEQSHQLNLLRLSDFNIQPCRGCYKCLMKECILKDDYPLLVEALLAADAIIVAAPTYFLGANGLLKLALDRGLALHAHIDRLWGKPSVGVAVAGIKGKEGRTLLDIQSYLKLVMTDMKKVSVVYGALPGEIFMNAENKAVAEDLGRRLFSAAPEAQGPCCPLCGGETFRFIDERHVRCMLCSNQGHFKINDGRMTFMIERSGRELFLTKADIIEHSNWLKGMKSKFLQHKAALSDITKDYKEGGCWVQPPKKQGAPKK